nr:hypothetical protein [Comamonas thiooxydans]
MSILEVSFQRICLCLLLSPNIALFVLEGLVFCLALAILFDSSLFQIARTCASQEGNDRTRHVFPLYAWSAHSWPRRGQ